MELQALTEEITVGAMSNVVSLDEYKVQQIKARLTSQLDWLTEQLQGEHMSPRDIYWKQALSWAIRNIEEVNDVRTTNIEKP